MARYRDGLLSAAVARRPASVGAQDAVHRMRVPAVGPIPGLMGGGRVGARGRQGDKAALRALFIVPTEEILMASNRNTIIRSMHDLGAAAWFGGTLMGAVGVNGASKDVSNPLDRAKVASSRCARWAPCSAVAIGAHLVGGAGLLLAHRDRVRGQAGVGANTAVKTALTAAALATTAYSGVL